MTFSLANLAAQKSESWKYTSLDLLKTRKTDGDAQTVVLPAALLPESIRFVFENGLMSGSAPDLADGITVGSFKNPGIRNRISNASKTAPLDLLSQLTIDLCDDGFVLAVPDAVEVATPIEIVFASSGEVASHLRLFITLGKGSQATIIERHIGAGAYTTTVRTDINLADGAKLHHYRLQDAPPEAIVLAAGNVTVGADATYESFACTLGGRLSRHQVGILLSAPGGTVHLNGTHIIGGDGHCDTSTLIEHAAPHCTSRQTYKQVLGGHARGVFQGKILVRDQAQKTDGFQLNQTLLLSPDAEVNGKPELEIYADDVKCSHGATIGQIDETALFYLRSRGIPLAQAKAMLVEAFVASALDLIEHDGVRAAFRGIVIERVPGGLV